MSITSVVIGSVKRKRTSVLPLSVYSASALSVTKILRRDGPPAGGGGSPFFGGGAPAAGASVAGSSKPSSGSILRMLRIIFDLRTGN